MLKDEFGFDVDEAAKVLSKVFGLDEMPAGKLQAQYGQIGRPDGDHLYSFRCDHQATARKARQVMLEGLHRAVTEASHEEPGVFGLEHLSVSTPTKAQKRDRCPSYLTTFSNDFAEEVDDSRSKRKRKATNLNDIGDAKYLPPGHRIPEERSSTNTTPAKPRTPKSARGANPKVPFELPNGKIIMITESKADAAKAPLRWPMLNVVSLPCHSGTLVHVVSCL